MTLTEEQRARIAYEAYASTLRDLHPTWSELPPWVKEAWARAIKAVDERDAKPPGLPDGRVYREDR